jgi:hypothetical protein
LWYANEGEDMLNRIVTGDDLWVHHYQPESKRASMQWKHPGSPSAKTLMPSAGKVMLTVFWDSQGVLLAHFQKCIENVNSALYYEVLLNGLEVFCELHPKDLIHRKLPGHLARGVLLHHDNTRPHTA